MTAKLIRFAILFASIECLWMPLVGAKEVANVDAAIGTTVKAHKRAIRACVDRYEDNAHGKLTSQAHIADNGQVTSVSIDSSLSPEVVNCVESEIKLWQFPALATSTSTGYDAQFAVVL